MIERQKSIRMQKAMQAAKRLGFQNTKLMLEGLSEQLRDFEYRSADTTSMKANRILNKIALIRNSMQNELFVIDEGEVNSRGRATVLSSISASIIFNGLAGSFFYMLPEIVDYKNQNQAALYKLLVLSVFSFIVIRELRSIFRDIRDHTFHGMKGNVEKLCTFIEKYVEKAVDDAGEIQQ
jgi:hypothetical protein